MPAIDEVLHQGRYRVTRRIGQNCTGEIYEAYDNALETNVVLKENLVKLKKVMTLSRRQALKDSFANEAKILTEIRHESFQQVQGYFSDIDRMYLVMETVDGNCLNELPERGENSFSVSDAMDWTEQLLDALNFLHAQNPPIIYGNLKPQNVKLIGDGKIKILASGIAGTSRIKPDTFANQNFDTANLHFLPLEQIWERLDPASQKVILNDYDEKSEKILKQPPDARSDIYALGATVYYLLTGQLPIDALERSIDILDGKPDPLPSANQINPTVPPEISEVLLKALEIRRENRFDSALIMRQVLRTAFVRIKEREAEEAKRRETLLTKISPEQKEAIAEQERLKAEAEKEREIELIRQQLREAEAQRLLAEHRAAEAEKRLLEKKEAFETIEKEAADFEETEPLPEAEALNLNEMESLSIPKFQEEIVSSAIPAVAAPEQVELTIPQANLSDEYEDLFSGLQKPEKSKRWMTAVALIVIAFSGVAFGVWFVIQSKSSAESNQTIPSQAVTSSVSNTAEPEITTETVPVVETAPEENELPSSSESDSPERTYKQLSPKSKSLPRTKKQTSSQTKTPPAQKKAVTVDDIINDN